MSARLKRNAHLLNALYKSGPQKRKDIMLHSSPDFVKTICEIALNILKGNISLSPSQYKTLKKYKTNIRLLADRKVGINRKRRILSTQRGGFFPLLGVIVPLLTEIISGVTRK